MTKKNWFYLSGSALALTIIIMAIYWLNINKQYQSANVLNHIPAQASCIMKIEGLSAYCATIDSVMYAAAGESLFFSDIDSTTRHRIISEIAQQPQLNNLLNRQIFISWHSTSNDSTTHTLVTVKLNNPQERKALETLLAPIRNKEINDTSHRIFMLHSNGNNILYQSINKGILYLSKSKELITQAINLQQDESLSVNNEFMSLYRTMSTTLPVSIIVQPSKYSLFSKTLSGGTSKNQSLMSQAQWIELDLSLKKNSIQANGFFVPKPNGFAALVIKNAPSSAITLDSVIPSNITELWHYGKDTRGLANAAYSEYLRVHGQLDHYTQKKDQLAKKYAIDYEPLLAELFHTEMAMYTCTYNGKQEHCLIIPVADSSDYFSRFKSIFSHNTVAVKNLKSAEGLNIPCFESDIAQEDLLFLNDYFQPINYGYYCQFHNTILVATSTETIEQNIVNRLRHNSLQSDKQYSQTKQQLSAKQQFSYMSSSLLNNNSTDKMQILPEMASLKHFGQTIFQFTTIQDLMYVSILMRYDPNREPETDWLWKVKPNARPLMNPTRVINHKTKEDEIIFTDTNNSLYLANNKGVILWEKPIHQKIIGTVSQIDYFKNGKLQYLFNDSNHIYLIDRNGNHVNPFPIKLPVKATNGVACFDYEKDGNYRFAIAGEDHKIYLFGRKGESIDGYNAPTPKNRVTLPLQHFRSAGKDYLVFHDGEKIYITNRKGEIRVTPDSTVIPNRESLLYLIHQDTKEASLITSSNKNEWVRIYIPSGKTELKSIFFEQNHYHHFLHIASSNRFIMLMGGKVLVLNNNGDMEYSTEAGSNHIAEAKVVVDTNAQQLISYRDTLSEQTFLIDQNGIAVTGYPIKANSLISIIQYGLNTNETISTFINTDNMITAKKHVQ